MRSFLQEALKKVEADYLEIRFEEWERTIISYQGRELENYGETVAKGGNVRALVKGGWGFVSFNSLEELGKSIALAIKEARLVGKRESRLATVPPVVDIVKVKVEEDPREIPLGEKIRLMEEYNRIILESPGIQSSQVKYRDAFLKKYFTNSEGSYLEQERFSVDATFVAIAREGDNIQQGLERVGGLNGFQVIRGIHSRLEEAVRRAGELLRAEPTKGGKYTVIIDPLLAGVFAHEAFGHTSEADFIYKNPNLKDVLRLGERVGSETLNIVDDGQLVGKVGYYKYDDEGVPASKTYLIKDGILAGRLHSRETAAIMGERPTGNARALDYRYEPIVRMSNTYIEPGEKRLEEMIAEVEEGIYAQGSRGGHGGELFTFAAEEAFLIRKGQLVKRLRDLTLSGNLYETLANIDAIGDDLRFGGEGGGGCGKDEQAPLPVGFGSPHIRIRNVIVGGR